MASNQSPSAIRTFAAGRPIPAALALATSSASADRSVIHTVTPSAGSSIASDRPIAPLPVPRSAHRIGSSIDRARCRATSTTSSVSGRGISTRRSTIKSRCRKPHRPSTYCNGSPLPRRANIESRWATPRWLADSSSASRNSSASRPDATSHIQRACGRPTRSDVSVHSWRQLTVWSLIAGELACPFVGCERVDDVVEIAGQHFLQSIDGEPDAVVGDPVLLVVVGADLLATAATADLRTTLGGLRRVLLVLGQLQQSGAQHLHRTSTVLQLTALVLHRYHDACRLVRDAHGGVRRVDTLTAGPARSIDVDLEVALVDLDLDLFGLRQYEHRCR